MNPSPPLSREDELALIAEFRTGTERGRAWARDRLVRHCWPCVLHFAGLAPKNRDDLVQVGAVGVMRALASFDPAMGTRLLTYVGPWVRKEVLGYIARNRSVVHVTAYGRGLGAEVRETPALEDIPDFDERSPEGQVLAADGDGPETLAAAREARAFVARLPARERLVLLARADGLTLEQAARQLGVTRQRAYQLEQGALATLRALTSSPVAARRRPRTTRGPSELQRAA